MSWEKDLIALYGKHFELVYRYFYYKFLSRELAEDLASDTFMSVAQDLRDGKSINNLERYLYGTARNNFIRALKRKYRNQIYVPLEESFMQEVTNFVSSFHSIPLVEVFKKLLPQLPASQQAVIKLRVVDGLNLKDTAERLGHNVNYVKVNQARAIANLKELIARTPTVT